MGSSSFDRSVDYPCGEHYTILWQRYEVEEYRLLSVETQVRDRNRSALDKALVSVAVNYGSLLLVRQQQW